MRRILNLKVLEKDGNYVSMKGDICVWNTRRWITLDIKDSWRLIPMALKKMPAALGYKDEAVKDIMYYEMFNHTAIGHTKRMTFA